MTFATTATDGVNPYGDLLLSGTMLYGMTPFGGTDALGTLFGISTDGSDYSVMHSFVGALETGLIHREA